MFYLFILESIGTAELLLIGLVALIVFGPRKLPEFARMLGKAKKEFRRTTDDFKQTWEREIDFESIEKEKEVEVNPSGLITENSIQGNRFGVPEIREVSQTYTQEISHEKDVSTQDKVENSPVDKRNWL